MGPVGDNGRGLLLLLGCLVFAALTAGGDTNWGGAAADANICLLESQGVCGTMGA